MWLLLMGLVMPAIAQKSSAPAFDVVSIKPSKPGGMMMISGASSNLFTSKGQSLWTVVMAAYFPKSFRYWNAKGLTGGPAWLTKENYDVEAKLDETTARQWANLSNVQRRERLMPILQAMLAERCKLVAHTTPSELQGFSLVVAKRGIRFKQTAANVTAPSGGVALPGGGWIIHHGIEVKPSRLTFVDVTMATVAEVLMGSGAHPIQDETGLTGRYDLEIVHRDDVPNTDPEDSSPYELGDVGLELKSAKVPSVIVVIDHMERPSTN